MLTHSPLTVIKKAISEIELEVPPELPDLKVIPEFVLCKVIGWCDSLFNPCYHLLGNPPLKETLTKLFSLMPHNRVIRRFKTHMEIVVDSSKHSQAFRNVSFESFKSIIEVLEHYEWVLPVVVWTHDFVYYTPFTELCIEKWCVISSVFSPVYKGGVRLFNCDGRSSCSFCKLFNLPMGYESLDISTKVISNLLYKKSKKLNPVIERPSHWSEEHYSLDNVGYDFELDSEKRDIPIREKLEELLNKVPQLRELTNITLPFEYVKPIDFASLLCPACITCYKPIWSWGNMKYYKEEAISLYLVLSNKGLNWDVVLQVLAFMVDLEVFKAFKECTSNLVVRAQPRLMESESVESFEEVTLVF